MVHNSFMEIISNNTSRISANNHILNTLSMKLFENLFGNSEFPLRLQSLIAHCLYLFFTFRLLKNAGNNIVILCGYLLLNVNPYLLDFFSLARGYAMAISFMLMSIYYFTVFIETQKQNRLVASFITAGLSVLSNFALLNYLALLMMMYELYLLYKYKPLKTSFKIILSKNIIVFAVLAIMLAICYEPIRNLRQSNQFYFGGENGFWHDTVSTLIDTFLYEQRYPGGVNTVIQALDALIPCCFVIVLFYNWLNKKKAINISGIVFICALLFVIALCNVQHILLGTKFLEERYALFIVPLFIFVAIYFFSMFIVRENTLRVPALFILISLAGASVYHFTRTANFTYTYNWKYDAATKTMLADLANQPETKQGRQTTLGITWLYEPSINFYRVTKKMNWLNEVDRSGPNGDFDYYYVDNRSSLKNNKNIIKEYAVTQSYLLKK